jgi:soluble lytic murein transglycosylase
VTKRRALFLSALAAIVIIAVAAVLLTRLRIRRHRLFPAAPVVRKAPAADWTSQFVALESSGRWADLAALLAQMEKTHPAEYARWSLGYLHARALIESDEPRAATAKLAPFLAPGHPLRDLALFHQSEIDDSSATRQKLIFEYPHALYRDQAIEEELEQLTDLKPLLAFAARLTPNRDVTARIVEAQLRAGDGNGALLRGLSLLKGGTTDDAADRVSRALDRPDFLHRLNAAELTLLGDALQNHRHFDRAVVVLSLSRTAGVPPAGRAASRRPGSETLPSQSAGTPAVQHDQLTFDVGRSYFGDEKYAQAQQTYLRGAATTHDPKWKATFLFHASRAAQLRGNDAAAEQWMTAAIAVPGSFPATSAALTQRLRTRLKKKRLGEAAADLAALRARFPKDHALVEGSIAYALGNPAAALATLNAIPPALFDKFDRYEVDYWRARALETSNPPAAFAAYLNVLRAPVPTHFAYFARRRVDAMQLKLQQELAARDAEVVKQIAAGNWDAARRAETDRYLLSPRDPHRLAEIYRHCPAYAAVIDRKPMPFPSFPLDALPGAAAPTRGELLMAMGLFDEAADDLPRHYDRLTRSLALNRGNASRESIREIEMLMDSVPPDYVPQLLPLTVRELLYPRYFYDAIAEDGKKYGADPTLLLSIMREESRFDPRAKSEAAARGLLQFIITTARDIGRQVGIVDISPDDLYDPRIIIRLGAKYVSELSQKLGGNRYAVAAAYNAGPHQVALWSRLAPAPGDDYFVSSINFEETKQYVRKVMNSYERYGEIYGNGAPAGGVRAEP